ncbi:MAG: AAA family ATPase [Magnetococcales bacterium]|nr:AAA family ATPase [Magnetococcales bacterium]
MSASPRPSSPNPQPERWDDVARLVTMARESEAYLHFLGLARNPFPVSPDADFFFLPTRIDALISEILHCIHTRKGFLMITGEVGLGKTTVSRRILRTLEETQVETAWVFNTFIQGSALLEEINRDFGIEAEGLSPREQMAALNRFLLERYEARINCAIVIDDAQNLTAESLELIRMISNLESHAEKLVQILLVGQSELEAKLEDHALRQLKSRIVLHARMTPYSLDELKRYISFKLHAAGSAGGVTIPDGGYRLLHRLTGGNPRSINNLMDRCLYALFAYSTTRLTPRLIRKVALELGMRHVGRAWGEWPKRLAWLLGALLVGALGVWVGSTWKGERLASETSAAVTEKSEPPRVEGRKEPEPEKKTPEESPPPREREPEPVRPVAESPRSEAGAGRPAGESGAQGAREESLAGPVLPEVKRFLASYGLEAYERGFVAGLLAGGVDGVARRIEEDKGLVLVVLREVPAEVRSGFAPLNFGPNHYLFWKPALAVKNFYYGYAGPEIKGLQEHLARIGFHPHPADGIVGRLLMNAVTRYQKARNLPVTGWPDATTLFLVVHDRKEGTTVAAEKSLAGSVAKGGSWVIQFMSLRQLDEAEKLQKELAAKKIETVILTHVKPDGSAWHAVRTPPVADRLRVEQMAKDLVSQFGVKGVIMPYIPAESTGRQ